MSFDLASFDITCTGTSIRDFVNVADESRFGEQTVVKLFGAPPADAMLVFSSPGEDEEKIRG
jgi:hypothetical protein